MKDIYSRVADRLTRQKTHPLQNAHRTTHIQKDIRTDRQAQTDRKRFRQKKVQDTLMGRQADKGWLTDKQIGRQGDMQTIPHAKTQTHKQTDIQASGSREGNAAKACGGGTE